MTMEASFETGLTTFKPITKRGHWAHPNDFIYAGIALVFRMGFYHLSWLYFYNEFCGFGYIVLVLNLFVIVYFSISAVIPLIFLLASMTKTLPPSCETFKNCTSNSKLSDQETDNGYNYSSIPLSNLIFANWELPFSLQLLLYSILFWSLVAFLIYKFFETEKMGLLIRYSVRFFIALLTICLIRFSFTPLAGRAYRKLLIPTWKYYIRDFIFVPIYGLSSFGTGWGLLITLSSFNKFQTNIKKSSWIIGLGQMLVFVALLLINNINREYYEEVVKDNDTYFSRMKRFPLVYLYSGSVIDTMTWPNLWFILFYSMLFLGALILIIIQLFAILTTIFDEYPHLRERRVEISFMVTGVIAFCSYCFISNDGIKFYQIFELDTCIVQNAFNFLLIIIVLWLYDHARFQRDLEFMINDRLPSCHIYLTMFLVPMLIILALLLTIFISLMEHFSHGSRYFYISVAYIFLIVFLIVLFALCQGFFLRKSYESNTWYPADAEQRQRYEEVNGTMVLHPV